MVEFKRKPIRNYEYSREKEALEKALFSKSNRKRLTKQFKIKFPIDYTLSEDLKKLIVYDTDKSRKYWKGVKIGVTDRLN